jgi:UDP:flavonoid glycosyltransferase YjiC (YdhE family)
MKVYDWIEDQDSVIRASEIVISRAGHGTIMKSLVHGKPMLLIPIPDHTEQYGNARRAKALHVAEIIDQARLDSGTLKAAVNQILQSDEYRKHCAKIQEEAASMRAVETACDGITSLAPS